MKQLVSIDFQAGRSRNRFAALHDVPGVRHLPLETPVADVADTAAYVARMLEVPQLGGEPTVVMTYCVAAGLLGEVTRQLEGRGAPVRHAILVDPQRAVPDRLVEAYDDVLRQLPGAVPTDGAAAVLKATPEQIGKDLSTAVETLVEPLVQPVWEVLELGPDEHDDPIAEALVARYRQWLRHALACYGASTVEWGVPIRIVLSASRDLASAGLAGFESHIVSRCEGDVFECGCLADVLLDP